LILIFPLPIFGYRKFKITKYSKMKTFRDNFVQFTDKYNNVILVHADKSVCIGDLITKNITTILFSDGTTVEVQEPAKYVFESIRKNSCEDDFVKLSTINGNGLFLRYSAIDYLTKQDTETQICIGSAFPVLVKEEITKIFEKIDKVRKKDVHKYSGRIPEEALFRHI